MVKIYYFDSCIWRDYFEDRSDNLRPLGEWAFSLLKKIIEENSLIIYSDLNERELGKYYSKEDINSMLNIIPQQILIQIFTAQEDINEAKRLSVSFAMPFGDALHVILAKQHNAIFVTRDRHFEMLKSRYLIKKPEELL